MEESEQSTRKRKFAVLYNEKQVLVTWHLDNGLRANIEKLKKGVDLNMGRNYDLKVHDTLSEKRRAGKYVTEKTYEEDIVDGTVLELVPALDDIIVEIFRNSSAPANCDSLYSLSDDNAFVDKIVQMNKVHELVGLLKTGNMNSKGKRGCLLTMLTLLISGDLRSIDYDIMQIIMDIVLNNELEKQYALSVLSQILYIKDLELMRIKEMIVERITVASIMPSVNVNVGVELSLNALMMINAIINTVRDERRASIIAELRQPSNRVRFYDLIKAQTVKDNLARELFILQTYLLSPYVRNLSKVVSCENLSNIGSNRNSSNVEDGYDSDADSMDLEIYNNRIEADVVSRDTISSFRYSLASLSTIRSSSSDSHNPNDFISELTNTCLTYYRKHYKKNFNLSLREENYSPPELGIARSSEKIVQMMAQVLNIGHKIYKRGTRYLPVYFNPETSYFFEEIFIRMMYLLSQNKRKMKAKTLEDFDKVIMGLKKQFELILDRKPDSLKVFTKLMSEVTYESVCKQWERERRSEWMRTLRSNPCIIQLSREISSQNEYLLEIQRISVLKNGGVFPKLPIKKKGQYFFLKLSQNGQMLLMGDSNDRLSDFSGDNMVEYKVDSISHFVTGLASVHVKDQRVPVSSAKCAFSIIFRGDSINCVAGDEKVANYWIDGFNILLGRQPSSREYYEELEVLTDLETTIQLVELQNVRIPTQPPKVPALPPMRASPAVPPKMRHSTIKSMSSQETLCDTT